MYRLAVMRQAIRPTCAISSGDRKHMQHALELAKRGLGRTHPNPVVGCVILKEGKVGQFTKLHVAVGHKKHPLVRATPVTTFERAIYRS